METNQVRYFLALCEEKNFTRAAKRCGVSQPSVSNAIKRLEEELGGDLFHRTKNGAKLSPLGAAIPYLDQINECAEGARREAAYISTADMVSISARANLVRRIFYGTAIPVCALFIGVLFGHQPYSQTTPSRSMASTSVDLAALEAAIDVKHLPRQNLSLEVYQ
jgi:Bacterial regulatory helix-turn-helix protein, lysR family